MENNADLPQRTGPSFSLIMPTYNRAFCIEQAILSVLSQNYQQYELIIIDDGSTDDTEHLVRERFHPEIESGRIRYIRRAVNRGVCFCRNIGLGMSRYEWIAYLDSDNMLRMEYLSVFAKAIHENPDARTFYAKWHRKQSDINGIWYFGPFSYDMLQEGNYIDMGVFVHHRVCYDQLGGFDENLKRLVDWELILRYTKNFAPVSLPDVVMDYDDLGAGNRITQMENYRVAYNYISSRYNPDVLKISVIIVCYNQERYVSQAIESVLAQTGQFWLEMIVSDDGSTDGTPGILAEYEKRYPTLIRNISPKEKIGISESYKRCFAAANGKYTAVLEGDAYWMATDKLSRQMRFLENNPDCSMVFTASQEESEKGDRVRLSRQQKIYRSRLTGYDMIANRHLNLIMNLSACMFVTSYMRELPDILYTARLSEITLAFYLERKGFLGYLTRQDSVYRSNGFRYGEPPEERFRECFETCQLTLSVAAEKYQRLLRNAIKREYLDSPLAEKYITEDERSIILESPTMAATAPITRFGILTVKGSQEMDGFFSESKLRELAQTVDRLYLVVNGEMAENIREMLYRLNLPVIRLGDSEEPLSLGAILTDFIPQGEAALYDEIVTVNLLTKEQGLTAERQEKESRLISLQNGDAGFISGRTKTDSLFKRVYRSIRENGIKQTVKRIANKLFSP